MHQGKNGIAALGLIVVAICIAAGVALAQPDTILLEFAPGTPASAPRAPAVTPRSAPPSGNAACACEVVDRTERVLREAERQTRLMEQIVGKLTEVNRNLRRVEEAADRGGR